MDDIDHIQEAAMAASEALLSRVRMRRQAEAGVEPPASRECDDCGCDIPTARLRLRPTARLCVDCQSDAESQRR